jgi:hypothetical protein
MKVAQLTAFFIITILFSCENVAIIDCQKCVTPEPVEADLAIKLSYNYQNASLSDVSVYEGDLEDNILLLTAVAYDSEFVVKVPINKKYTVTVTYQLQKGKYIAVDSALPRVKFDKDQCDEPCYYVYDNNINLRLKYQ